MRDPNDPCLFCTPRSITRRNALAYCARDSFPVSPGHSLIMPFRHCASFFELSPEEVAACMALVGHERHALDDEFMPDGYNVGVNVGRAGGQSVLHVHIHLIPRYVGDHPKPPGSGQRLPSSRWGSASPATSTCREAARRRPLWPSAQASWWEAP